MKNFLDKIRSYAVENIYNSVGRVNRMQYLKSKLLLFAIGFVLIISALLIAKLFTLIAPIVGFIASMILLLAASLPIFLGDILLGVRRLHDMNLNGWWMLLMFIPYINLVFTAFLFCWKGSTGQNKYDLDFEQPKVSLIKKVSSS